MPPTKETFQKGLALPFAGGRLVAAPYQFVTTGEENLRVLSANSMPSLRLKIQGLRLSERGENVPFVYDHVSSSDRSVAKTEHALGFGALLHLTVFAVGGSPPIGQTFVIVQVIRGIGVAATVLGTLLQGYVTSTQALGWPGSPIMNSTEGEPFIRVLSGTQPAAGADFSETCPTGARWELQRVFANYTASAVAGTRLVQFRLVQGGVVVALLASARDVIISESANFMWAQNLPVLAASGSDIRQQAIPDRTILNSGDSFISFTTGMLAGDQWAAPRYVVREWLEVP